MKIFITGATGFIGTQLVRRLAGTGHELHCLVRRTSDVRELRGLGAVEVIGDVTDERSLLRGMTGCQWVINLAGVYSYWEPNKRIYADVNINGTRNVMKCALEAGVSKVAHVSTATVYGKPTECPFNEESPVSPVRFSEYARTKYEGELFAWELYRSNGLPLVVMHPGAILGPGDTKATGQYILDLIHRRLPATAFGDAILTFFHVKDVADAIVRALEKENNVGQRYLIGKHQLSMGEFTRMVSEISGVPAPAARLPGYLVTINASLITLLANLTKRPPMSLSQK